MKTLIALAVLFSLGSASQAGQVVEKVLAVVNDQVVTLSDLETFKAKVRKDGLVDELLFAITPKETVLKDRKALIEHLIYERLIDSEIKKQGLTATIERVEQEIRNVSSKNNMSRNQLKEALAGRGINFSEYQDFIKTGIERQMLVEKAISSRVKVSDEDIASFYSSKKGESDQIYEFSISHILFSPEHGGEDAAKARADKVLAKLNEGTPFEKLVSQYTEEINFSSGGHLGNFKVGEMAKDIETAIAKLGTGQTSGVVRTKMGYHIFKVNKKTLVSNPKLEAEKAKIRDQLFQQNFNRQLKAWLNQRKSEAFIRINE